MGIKQLYKDNLGKLPNEYGDVSVMINKFKSKMFLLIKRTPFSFGHSLTAIRILFLQRKNGLNKCGMFPVHIQANIGFKRDGDI